MAYVSHCYTVGTNYKKLNTISQLQQFNEILVILEIDAADIYNLDCPDNFSLFTLVQTDLWVKSQRKCDHRAKPQRMSVFI